MGIDKAELFRQLGWEPFGGSVLVSLADEFYSIERVALTDNGDVVIHVSANSIPTPQSFEEALD